MHQEEEYLEVEDVRKKLMTNSYWTQEMNILTKEKTWEKN